MTICLYSMAVFQVENWRKIERSGMTFQWMIEGANMRCKVMAPTLGWIAIGFNSHSGLTGTNLLMGAVEQEFFRIDDRYIVAPEDHKSMIQMGEEDQVTLINGIERNGITTIEFLIPLQPKDKLHQQLIEGREYHLLMAFSAEDDFDHHSIMRTSTKIKL